MRHDPLDVRVAVGHARDNQVDDRAAGVEEELHHGVRNALADAGGDGRRRGGVDEHGRAELVELLHEGVEPSIAEVGAAGIRGKAETLAAGEVGAAPRLEDGGVDVGHGQAAEKREALRMLAGHLGTEIVAGGGHVGRLGVVAHVHVRRRDAHHGEIDVELPHRRQMRIDGPVGDGKSPVQGLKAVPREELPVRGRQVVRVDVDLPHNSPFDQIE